MPNFKPSHPREWAKSGPADLRNGLRVICRVILQLTVTNSLLSFYCTIHTALMACMCPVDHVCHQLTCHWRLLSLSRMRNRCFIALFTPIDFAISATPTGQRTLFTYLRYV